MRHHLHALAAAVLVVALSTRFVSRLVASGRVEACKVGNVEHKRRLLVRVVVEGKRACGGCIVLAVVEEGSCNFRVVWEDTEWHSLVD
jgi:hypothetical protein